MQTTKSVARNRLAEIDVQIKKLAEEREALTTVINTRIIGTRKCARDADVSPKYETKESIASRRLHEERKLITNMNGKTMCVHKLQRRMCIQCNMSSKCEHNKVRTFCYPCGGNAYCEHGVKRQGRKCTVCYPTKP